MNTRVDKASRNKSQAGGTSSSKLASSGKSTFQFADNRPEAITQRKLQDANSASPHVQQLKTYQTIADQFISQTAQRKNSSQQDTLQSKFGPIQKKENNTGLPDHLKSGVENLSGYSMDDVKVHYNSAKPAQLQAHAFAQGTDIHLTAGQEKHLPHEAWHVVQQKQGRVKPTMQLKGAVNVNDDTILEKEADVMGASAIQLASIIQAKTFESQEAVYPLQMKAENNSGTIAYDNVAQLKLDRKDAVALRIYTKDKYDGNPHLTADELQGIHRAAVFKSDNLEQAKAFFDRVAGQAITFSLQALYAPIIKLFTKRFRDGAERERSNLNEVLINLLLVQQGIRPAFLLQWIDYDAVYRPEIKSLIMEVINTFFEDGTFVFKEIDQGLLVIDTLKLKWVKGLIDHYEKSDSSKALGLALGYPAAGEIDSQGQRYFAHIVTPDGGDVMSNICDNVQSLQHFKKFFERVNEISERVLGIKLQLVIR